MITEKNFIGPEERANKTQKIIERAKERCEKINDIIAARNELLKSAKNKIQGQIIDIGSDFIISQI